MTSSGRYQLPGIAQALLLATLFVLQACGGSGQPAGAKRALIIVDMQYDFMPGGSLPAVGADEIAPVINQLQADFDLVVATQDWHPPGHESFASSHPGHEPGDIIDLHGLQQELWPDHAVQGSSGAELAANLDQSGLSRVFRKGTNPRVDSYSGFFDNGQKDDTGLNAYLRSQGVSEVYVVGLALDYCVKYTALDAQRLGYNTTVILDASRAVNLAPKDGDRAVSQMQSEGVRVITSNDLSGR